MSDGGETPSWSPGALAAIALAGIVTGVLGVQVSRDDVGRSATW